MNKDTKTIKNLPEESSVISFMEGSPTNDDFSNFPLSFHSRFLARMHLNILRRCVITPEIIKEITRLFLLFTPKPVSYIIVVGKDMRIKYISPLTTGFKAVLSEFSHEVIRICNRHKCKKCILIYNYTYKKGVKNEIFDVSALYNSLRESGITLVDAVKYTDSTAENIISVYNKNGYKK